MICFFFFFSDFILLPGFIDFVARDVVSVHLILSYNNNCDGVRMKYNILLTEKKPIIIISYYTLNACTRFWKYNIK